MSRPAPDTLDADLSALLDGELDPQRAAELRRRVEASPELHRRLEALRDVRDVLAALPRQRAPESFAGTIAGIAERRRLFEGAPRVRRARWWWPVSQVGAAAAVLLLCVYVGWQALQPTSGPSAADGRAVDALAKPPAPSARGYDRMAGSQPRGEEIPELVASDPWSELTRADAAQPEVRPEASDLAPGSERLASAGASEGAAIRDSEAAAPGAARGTLRAGRAMAGAADGSLADVDATRSLGFAASGAPADIAGPESFKRATRGRAPTMPSVDVVIAPANVVEFYATVDLVDGWADAKLSAGDAAWYAAGAMGPPAEAAPLSAALAAADVAPAEIQRVLAIPATELRSRIAALGLSVGDPERVRVQMNLDARTIDVLSETAASPAVPQWQHFASRAPAAGYLGDWAAEFDTPGRAEVSTDAENVAAGDDLAASADADARAAAGEVARPAREVPAESAPASGDGRAGAPGAKRGVGGRASAREKLEESERFTAEEWLNAPDAPELSRTGPRRLTSVDEARRRRLERRHQEATEIIIIVPDTQPAAPPASAAAPPASAPAPGAARAEAEPAAAAEPSPAALEDAASRGGEAPPTIHELTRRLLDNLLAGGRLGQSFGLDLLPPEEPASTTVQFRVRVLPPPGGAAVPDPPPDSGAQPDAAAQTPGE